MGELILVSDVAQDSLMKTRAARKGVRAQERVQYEE
jgi:hypothetical protein